MNPRVQWPNGKRFAFTVFDDTDSATLANVGEVYALLSDLGFRTTKTCWPLRGDASRGANAGQTCADADYLKWLLDLQERGFEMGWHGATWHSSSREETIQGLDTFAKLFGRDPVVGATHTGQNEGIYWADHRLTGWRSLVYSLITRMRNRGRYRGHIEGDRHFWGDICRARVTYYRNFVFQDIDTLKACPMMPYHDPRRLYVNQWFASSNGVDLPVYNRCLAEENQDRLEEQGGACVMYTHFAFGFMRDGKLDARFRSLMERLARKGGWFVPTGQLLDYLVAAGRGRHITAPQRGCLERKWLLEKIMVGST